MVEQPLAQRIQKLHYIKDELKNLLKKAVYKN